MRADRSRVFTVFTSTVAIHTLPALFLLPGRAAILGLIGLFLVAAAHKSLFVRLMPPLPSSAPPTLATLARGPWLVRALAVAALTVAAFIASLGYHSILLRPCPAAESSEEPPPSCADAGSSAFAAAWAALLGLLVGGEFALGRDAAELPTVATTWPLVALPPLLRLRPALPAAAVHAARLCAQCALALLLIGWLAPTTLLRLGTATLSMSGGCVPCEGSGTTPTSSPLPGFGELVSLALVGFTFRMSCSLALACVRVAYTRPLDFRETALPLGGEGEAALEAGMAASSHPLTLHLAFLDAVSLATHEPRRRQALFALERGAAWLRFLKLLLRPLDAASSALEAARKRRGAPPPKLPYVPFVPLKLLQKMQALHIAVLDQAARYAIFSTTTIVSWAAEASSGLIAAAATEDALGAVHLSNSLGTCLTALLRCLVALEAYVAGGAPFGSQRPPQAVHRSQQSLALRVALGPPRVLRAAGAQRAAALESSLSRAVYLLVKTYGVRAVRAANVAPELRARLDMF